MIYLIGVNHALQCLEENPSVGSINFYNKITTYCNEYNIQVLLEEFSEDAKSMWNCIYSVLEKVSIELEIDHFFCDPGNEERDELNIGPYDHDKREEYWMNCIENNEPKESCVLFVCGNKHITNMKKNFSEKDWEYIILDSK